MNYTADLIKKVVDYCKLINFNSEIPYLRQIKDDTKLESIIKDEREREFVMKLDVNTLSDLIALANFLNMKRLLELCCVRIAYNYRASEKNIEKIFEVPMVINENEELKIKKENPRAFEVDSERLKQLKMEDELDKLGNN